MANTIGGGFFFSVESVGGTWTWSVQTNNRAGANQKFTVGNINTPFGELGKVSIPIPDDVIDGFTSSLDQVRNQLKPTLYLNSPSVINLTVDEGDSRVNIPDISFSNVGAIGSFMDTFISTDSYWLVPNRTSVIGVPKNGSASVSGLVYSDTLFAVGSPYTGHISLSYTGSDDETLVTYNIAVRPKPIIQLDIYSVGFSYDLYYSTGSGAIGVNVTNAGPLGSLLSLSVVKSINKSPWLVITGADMIDIESGNISSVMLSLDTSKITRVPGLYQEVLVFKPENPSVDQVVIPVNLTVT